MSTHYRNSRGEAVKTLLTPAGELLAAELAGALADAPEDGPEPAVQADSAGHTAVAFSPRSWNQLLRGEALTPGGVRRLRRLAGLPARTP